MMNQPKACVIHAPGKINLHLDVGKQRSDGFHDLESLFVSLDFGDDLFFEPVKERDYWELRVNCFFDQNHGAEFAGDDNLISRAARLFREQTGCRLGLRCVLDKHIPLAAGLGGGSSDAASTLLALNLLSGADLSPGELLKMAASLGSDVPFFLAGGAARVRGRGERIEPLPALPNYRVLLVKPPFSSATGEAFRLLDRYREKNQKTPDIPGERPLDIVALWQDLPEKWTFFNSFLPVLPEEKAYRDIISGLKDLGAAFAGLSGSGSTCFGIFTDPIAILSAEKTLRNANNHQNFIQSTFFLASKAIPVLQ